MGRSVILESLPDDVAEVVRHAGSAAIDVQRRESATRKLEYRTQMESHGIWFVDLTNEQRAEFLRASVPAVELARGSVPVGLFDLAGT